jgi:ferredoxin-NADP reductase
MHRPKVLWVIALIGVGWAWPVWGQPVVITAPGGPGNHFFISAGGGGFPPMPPMVIPPLMMGMQAAHLTADQRKQVGQIMQSNAAQTAPLVEQLHSIHEQIADKLLAPGTVTAADLAPLETQATQIDGQIQQQALNASIQIRGILSPDQVSRMAQFHKKMAALQAQMRDLMKEESPPPPPPPAP